MLRVAVARVPEPPAGGEVAQPGWFGESERRRWGQLAARARPAFVASRALLRELLQAATGVPAPAWDVSAQAGSAPVARAAPGLGDVGAIHASLSHRLGWVAAAVADVPVGIDIEVERPARSEAADRAALMLSPDEIPAWQSLPADERDAALLARWAAKEAWFKASPPGAAPWDFRHVAARACGPVHANVRTWTAPPLQVAVCCADSQALADVRCDGLADLAQNGSWHVHRVVAAA